MIRKHIYHFFFTLFYPSAVSEDQVFYYSRIHKYSIHSVLELYNFIEFIILLYTFLVISFVLYKEYTICLISSSKFSDVLPAFTCASVIGNI